MKAKENFINSFEEMLSGGHPNSLGRTVDVVSVILSNKSKLDDLYQCYSSDDEVVRLRVSNAFKRVCKEQPEWLFPYIDRFIHEISKIDQASTKWTFAQLMMLLDSYLSENQKSYAVKVMQRNLKQSDDWIVLNFTMEALTKYAHHDQRIRNWLLPYLKKYSIDSRRSVAKRATKFIKELQ